MKKIFEPVTDRTKFTSEKLTKTLTEYSIKNNRVLENFIKKTLKLMIDKCMIAPYVASSLNNVLKPETKNQFRVIKEEISIRINNSLIRGYIPVTLYCNMCNL